MRKRKQDKEPSQRVTGQIDLTQVCTLICMCVPAHTCNIRTCHVHIVPIKVVAIKNIHLYC